MFVADTHTHSVYSFDGKASVDALCRSATKKGISLLAITDHCDIDCIVAGIYPPFDEAAVRRDIEAAKAAYAGKLTLVRGVELGQPGLCPEEVNAFLRRGAYDFVIGSCHNLAGVPDFFFLNYTHMPEVLLADLYRRSLLQLTETAALPGIHTIAHILYPLRYMAVSGRKLELSRFEGDFRALFSVMRENGVALELNMKGLRKGDVTWDEEGYVLRLWRDAGGRLVTVGSDAHTEEEISAGLHEAYDRLPLLGFSSVAVPKSGILTEVSILP